MLEIYSRDGNGIESVVATYETIEAFFDARRPNEDDLKNFGYKAGDRTSLHRMFPRKPFLNDPWYYAESTRSCYLAYEYDKLITPDNLVGRFRAWVAPPYRYRWTYRRSAWLCPRAIKTTQERRAFYANDDEDAPRIRAKRAGRRLPDSWDRGCYSSEKCWKAQSKRKHQWK